MSDLSWRDALVFTSGNSGSGGEGVTSYNQLSHRPIQNVSGDPVVISELPSGVYNIDGTWTIMSNGKPQTSNKDDIFYVSNEAGICKMTWITAGEIYTYSTENSDDASEVMGDRVTKESDCKDHCNGDNDPNDLIGSF